MISIVELPCGVEAALIHRMPTDHDARGAWLEWARRHGIDPYDVVIPGGIFRDVHERRLSYVTVERDERGSVIIDEQGDVAERLQVVHLDREPEPFPTEADQ